VTVADYRQLPSYMIARPLPLLPDRDARLPCVQAPRDYDEDQPRPVRADAARRCRRECPQLTECRALLASLPEPRGVIAGVVIPRHRLYGSRSRRFEAD
jgi:hypothetical protein